jgi:hypothetical protein
VCTLGVRSIAWCVEIGSATLENVSPLEYRT